MLRNLLILSAFCQFVTAINICTSQSYATQCKALNETNEITCFVHSNIINCLLTIENGTNTLAAVTPEEAIVAGQTLKNIFAVAQVKPENDKSKAEYETVVLITDTNVTQFEDLRGKKLCHPGNGVLIKGILNKFEDTVFAVVSKNKTGADTITEGRLKTSSEFFGPQCRVGPWTDNLSIDAEYQTKYPKLCELCADKKCPTATKNPFGLSLQCFQNGGDVVITTMAEIARANLKSPVYLCEDGKASEKACVWSKSPWPLIVGSKNELPEINEFLNKYAKDKSSKLKEIFAPKPDDVMHILLSQQNLKDYLKDFESTWTTASAGPNVYWCTASDEEMEKCQWLRKVVAAKTDGPQIDCMLDNDELGCIEKINKEAADIAVISTSNGYAARKKNIMPIAFPDVGGEAPTKVMVVIKSSADFNQSFGFSDLKDKFGCFSEFGDVSYVAFMANLTEIKIGEDCNYEESAHAFLGESCLPGLNDQYRKPGIEDFTKLCNCASSSTSKTASICSANSDNEYYGNKGALKCLREVGDFAVITNKDLTNLTDQSYTVLCKNGSLSPHPGLEVDDDCYLAITTNKEFVIREKNPNFNNIKSLLSQIYNPNVNSTFKLLDSYNNTENLLYPDTSKHILYFTPDENAYIGNYVNLFEDLYKCRHEAATSSSSLTMYTVEVVVISLIPTLISYF